MASGQRIFPDFLNITKRNRSHIILHPRRGPGPEWGKMYLLCGYCKIYKKHGKKCIKSSDDNYASSWILLDHMSSYWWRKKNAKKYIHIYCCLFVGVDDWAGQVSILRPQKSYRGDSENENPITCTLKMDGLNLYSSKSRLDLVILESQLISSFLNAKYHVAVDEGRWVI